MLPSAAAASKAAEAPSAGTFSASMMVCNWPSISSTVRCLRLNCRHRDRMVMGIRFGSVVANRNLT